MDLSHRILAVTAWDQGLFQASFSTGYRVLKARNLMTTRGPTGPASASNGEPKNLPRAAGTGKKIKSKKPAHKKPTNQ